MSDPIENNYNKHTDITSYLFHFPDNRERPFTKQAPYNYTVYKYSIIRVNLWIL